MAHVAQVSTPALAVRVAARRLVLPEAQARLDRLAALWRELKRAPKRSGACEALVRQIRAESDAYNALVDAKLTQVKPGEPSD